MNRRRLLTYKDLSCFSLIKDNENIISRFAEYGLSTSDISEYFLKEVIWAIEKLNYAERNIFIRRLKWINRKDYINMRRWFVDIVTLSESRILETTDLIIDIDKMIREISHYLNLSNDELRLVSQLLKNEGKKVQKEFAKGRFVAIYGVPVCYNPFLGEFIFENHRQTIGNRAQPLNIKPPPKVGIIILNYNGYNDTVNCLRSIENISYPFCEVIVLDNGSKDDFFKLYGNYEKLRTAFPNIPMLRILRSEENLGFAEGNNIAIDYCNANYVLLLNNDTIVDSFLLEELVSFAEDRPEIGIVGPTVYVMNKFGKSEQIESSGHFFYHRKILNNSVENKLNEPIKVDYVIGAAMLIRTFVWRLIGGFDSRYFAYCEEDELSMRANENGFFVYNVPSAKIWHKGGTASGGWYSEFTILYRSRNRLLTFNKHFVFLTFSEKIIYIIHYIFFIGNLIRNILSKKIFVRFVPLFKGVYYGLLNKADTYQPTDIILVSNTENKRVIFDQDIFIDEACRKEGKYP